MPEFLVTDPESGQKIKLTGDSPPTEDELMEVFAGTITPTAAAGTRSILGEIAEVTPEIVGGIAGATAVPINPIVGAVGGAAVGRGLFEAGRVAFGGEPKPVGEVVREIGLAGVSEAVGGAAVKVGGKILKAALPAKKPFIRAVSPEAQEAIEVLRPRGGALTLAQATENKFFDIAQNVAEGSAIGGGRIVATKQAASREAVKVLDEFIEQFGTTTNRAEIKEVLANTINRNDDVFRIARNSVYKKLDDVTGDTIKINLGGAKKTIESKAKNLLKFRSQLNKSIASLDSLADDVSLSDADNIKSLLFAEAEKLKKSGGNARVVDALTATAKTIEKNIDTAAKSVPTEAKSLWDLARSVAKQKAEIFNNKLVKKIAREDPQAIIDRLLTSPEPTDVLAVKKAVMSRISGTGKIVPDPAGEAIWRNVQGRLMERLKFQSVRRVNGVKQVSGDALLDNIDKLKELGKDTLKNFFPNKGEAETFEKFARVLGQTQKGQEVGTGKVAVQLVQAGAAINIFREGARAASATVLLGPAAMAGAFSNPKVVDFIVKGSKGIRTVEAANKFVTRLGVALAKEGIEHELIEKPAEEQRQTFGAAQRIGGL
jgi:hypothetical protein